MRTAPILVAILSLRAQSGLSPDLDTLTKVRTRMVFNLTHQPNYTCIETVQRFYRVRQSAKLKIIDTLRLEVGVVDGREMFAWPGAKKFEHFDITKMVTSGAIANGDFSSHARALFTTQTATFHYVGVVDFKNKRAIRFDYVMPEMLSGYTIQVPSASAIVGYHGAFYADPQTFDLERIDVLADDLPLSLMLASADDHIDYAVEHIGDGDFLLPSQSALSMIDLHGAENHNVIKFDSCREFTGDAVLTFGDSVPDTAPAPVREFDLPPGLEIELALTSGVDLAKAAIGDPVHASVKSDVKQKGETVIPKGATATGRITRIEKYETYWIVGVEFSEIDAPGIAARVTGNLDRTAGITPVRSRYSMTTATPRLPGEGVFPVNAWQRYLAKGCIMFWRT